MPSYKLTYFDTKGRAEMIRLLFAAAGVNYEDCRLTKEEFVELKSSGKLPFNQLPVLEVDGKILAQSCTIFKYVARETGFAPIDSFEVAKADMIMDGIDDVMSKALKFYIEKDEETKKKLMKEFYENHLPQSLVIFEKLLKSSGGKYFADNKLTYADIRFFSSMDLLFQEIKEDIPPILDNYPTLKDLYSTVRSNAGIKEWLSKRQ